MSKEYVLINGSREPVTLCVDCGIRCFDTASATQAARDRFGVVVCNRCGGKRDPEWPKLMGWVARDA